MSRSNQQIHTVENFIDVSASYGEIVQTLNIGRCGNGFPRADSTKSFRLIEFRCFRHVLGVIGVCLRGSDRNSHRRLDACRQLNFGHTGC